MFFSGEGANFEQLGVSEGSVTEGNAHLVDIFTGRDGEASLDHSSVGVHNAVHGETEALHGVFVHLSFSLYYYK